MARSKAPIFDVRSILLCAAALHPLSKTSRQLHTEFHLFEEDARPTNYLFVLDNFDLKQTPLIAGAMYSLDEQGWHRRAVHNPYHHICFAVNEDAVSSARELYSFVEEHEKLPPGLEYIARRMTKWQIRRGLTPSQAKLIYQMFTDVDRKMLRVEADARPVRRLMEWFKWRVKLHKPQRPEKW